MNTLLPYIGQKSRLTRKHYVKLFPYHTHFIDVFGGSGAVILNKPPSRLETYNDIDPHLTNMFRVIRNGDREQLKHLCEWTPGRDEGAYKEALEILAQPITDPVRSAWAMLTAAHQSISTGHPAKRQYNFSRLVKPRSDVRRWNRIPPFLDDVASRFRNVQILDGEDWRRVLARFDRAETLFFVDPPYHPDTVSGDQYYTSCLTVADHRELVGTVQGLGAKVFLCGYAHPDYDGPLANWRRVEIPVSVRNGVKGGQNGAKEARETVWMNYDKVGRKIEE